MTNDPSSEYKNLLIMVTCVPVTNNKNHLHKLRNSSTN